MCPNNLLSLGRSRQRRQGQMSSPAHSPSPPPTPKRNEALLLVQRHVVRVQAGSRVNGGREQRAAPEEKVPRAAEEAVLVGGGRSSSTALVRPGRVRAEGFVLESSYDQQGPSIGDWVRGQPVEEGAEH